MIKTIWQPSYTPPAMQYQPKAQMKTSKDRVLAYLGQHGATTSANLCLILGVTKAQLRYASEVFAGTLLCEQSGNGRTRVCLYWVASNPPATSARCATHRAYEWIKKNPWCPAADIPSDIYPVPKHKHAGVCTMERNGRLISRVKNGKKQYKAVL